MDEMEFEESMRAATPKDPSSELEAMRTTSQDFMDLDCLARTHNKDTVTGGKALYHEVCA